MKLNVPIGPMGLCRHIKPVL